MTEIDYTTMTPIEKSSERHTIDWTVVGDSDQFAPITAEEFERGYAERSRLTVEELRRWRVVATCDCGEADCQGFQSISPRNLKDSQAEGKPWKQVLP